MSSESVVTTCDMMHLEGVSKTFSVRKGIRRSLVRALDNVELRLPKGHVLGVIGESGSGKSTLANIVMGLEVPDSGTMLFDGALIDMQSKRARATIAKDIQVVFQDPYSSLNPRFDVLNLLKEPLRHIRFSSKKGLHERCVELLNMVGLPESALEKHPHEFSGGQRQRIAIARSLALEPKVLVCDEAVSALDVSIQAQILELLTHLQSKLGLSIVFIAHGLHAVERICDEVMVMNSGRVVEQGPANQILQEPVHPYTQQLVAVSRDIIPFKYL